MRPRLAALLLVILLFGGGFLLLVALALTATVMVRDPTGEAVRAAMLCDHDEQVLYDLPGGVFAGFAGSLDCDGTVEIRCRDGSRDQSGYVTSGMSTRLRVGPGCRLADD